MIQNDYQQLEEQIGLHFPDLTILTEAFVHKSYVNENRSADIKHNERLEFLGDAVLELAATNYLFKKYPKQNEGKLTSYRSALVKGNHLAKVSQELELGQYLYLSRGEEKSGGRTKPYLLANVMEALIGAIYLTHGYEAANKFINEFILVRLEHIILEGSYIDGKSQLQEIAQEKEHTTPHYELIEESGPDHDKLFIMGVYIGEKLISQGRGSSKQKAERDAAKNALNKLKW